MKRPCIKISTHRGDDYSKQGKFSRNKFGTGYMAKTDNYNDMKKGFILLLCLIQAMLGLAQQSKVSKTITPIQSSVPVVFQNNVKGGLHQAADLFAADLEDGLKQEGMLVWDLTTQAYYKWNGSMWAPVSFVKNWVDSGQAKTGDLYLKDGQLYRVLADNEIDADLAGGDDTDPANDTNWQPIANDFLKGTELGQMQYWDGSAWVLLNAGYEGASLQMIGGIPAWTGGTPPIPNVTNPTTGKTWMDRNLGAAQAAISSTDAAAYGDLYQWGRAADGHEKRTSGTTASLSSSDSPGHGDFITTSSPYDWRSPKNDNLWQGVSGINNPCPSGYRLPTEAEWEAERLSWSSNNTAGAFASPLKLPLAGHRSYSPASLRYVGSSGFYWSGTVASTYSRNLRFLSSNAYMASYFRVMGLSVRCLKD